ncbi:MAG: Zn-ribbon domain-containing OB-fold protein [Armatimonadota bacterium]
MPARSAEAPPAYGDALTAPFWEAAARHELIIQRCQTCGMHQFYPRPFCLACESNDVLWVSAAGTGTVYSMTTVRMHVSPELVPPYIVAIVELDEGPRLMANIVEGICRIGDRVQVTWRERAGAPPLHVFRPAAGESEGGRPQTAAKETRDGQA